MTLTEFWWEFDFKMKTQKQLKTQSKGGKFSEAEWEAARKKFKELENGKSADRSSR